MSDEISRRLNEAAAAHGAAAESMADATLVAASIIGPARRRRRVTGAASVAAALTAVGLFAGGTLAVVDSLNRRDASPAAPVVAMSQTPSPVATESPSPAPSAAITEFPPTAAARGDGFPDAYEMRDWVWDHVGEGWSVRSYSAAADASVDSPRNPPGAVLYLVDPEGVAFELAELGPEYSLGARVVSWQEDERTAHLVWEGDNESIAPGGAVIDLATGTVSPIVFATPWGQSSTVAPLAVSATGNELWEAWLGTHVRFYRYGTADGWTVATANDLEGISDRTASPRWDTAEVAGEPWLLTRQDSAAVLFELRPTRDGSPTAVAVYDLDADVYVSRDVTSDLPKGAESGCIVTDWVGDATLSYDCGGSSLSVTVATDAGVSADAHYGDPMYSGEKWEVLGTAVVGYREATSPSYLVAPRPSR